LKKSIRIIPASKEAGILFKRLVPKD